MRYKLLGRSGLRVSELCLGCGTFGVNWGSLGSDHEESRRILDYFLEAGGNYLDTSNRYQEGQSEQWLGGFLEGRRQDVVIGTKYSLYDQMTNGRDPNAGGNHRKNLVRSIEGSLRRLRTDYIDLLWIHIADLTTPVDEILRMLDALVRSGKVLYIGASNFPAWWMARANTLADAYGWTPFIATQAEYSIVERSLEPEFLPMCAELDIAIVCWSALGGGMVTGKYNRPPLDTSVPNRLMPHVDPQGHEFWTEATKRNLAIMDKVVAFADGIGRKPVEIALRFLMQQRVPTIPIFSVRTVAQCREALGAVEFELSPEEIAELDRITLPAISSVMPEAGPYPYPMLEYGSPALPNFYSRVMVFGDNEAKIDNHRRKFPYRHQGGA